MIRQPLPTPGLRPGPSALSPAEGRPDVPGLVDRFGRTARDLRISVTEKCSLRCTYCMPEIGLPAIARTNLLTPREIARLVEIAVRDDSPAYGIVKWLDTKLIGHSFIGFFHRFAGNYEPQVRFHLSPDDPHVMAAVRDASALNELSKP